MLVARPTTLAEVFDALDELPGAHLLAGGTDLMVEVNFGHRRPPAVVALRRVEELKGYDVLDDEVVLRAGVTWTEIENDLAGVLPGMAATGCRCSAPSTPPWCWPAVFFLVIRRPRSSTLFPYTTLFRTRRTAREAPI